MKLLNIVKTAGKIGMKVAKFNLALVATTATVGAVIGAVEHINQRQPQANDARSRTVKSDKPMAQILRVTDTEENVRFTYHVLTPDVSDSIIEQLNHLMHTLHKAYAQLKEVDACDSERYLRWAIQDRKYLDEAVQIHLLSSLIDLSQINHIVELMEIAVSNVTMTYEHYQKDIQKLVDSFSLDDVNNLIECVNPELREEYKEFIEA